MIHARASESGHTRDLRQSERKRAPEAKLQQPAQSRALKDVAVAAAAAPFGVVHAKASKDLRTCAKRSPQVSCERSIHNRPQQNVLELDVCAL